MGRVKVWVWVCIFVGTGIFVSQGGILLFPLLPSGIARWLLSIDSYPGVIIARRLQEFYSDPSGVVLLIAGVNTVSYGLFAMGMFMIRHRVHRFSDVPRELVRVVSFGIGSALRVQAESVPASVGHPVHITSIEIHNIRCFQRLELQLEEGDEPFQSSLFVGDNATGKSTLLRCIALGLCPESDATALIKKLKGELIRTGATEGKITLRLSASDFDGEIITTLEHDAGGRETARKTTSPSRFPWDRIFVGGYGTQRTKSRPTSPKMYLTMDAVSSLFSDDTELLNPESVFGRGTESDRERVRQTLMSLLLLDEGAYNLHRANQGLQFHGPWGEQPLEAISDGYRSTTQWVLDLIGRQFLAERALDSGGILLLDEIEQHLHPRWQRHVIQRIRSQFPGFQLIASTHTPLTAGGATDLTSSQMTLLDLDEEGIVRAQQVHASAFKGMRADQLLTALFGLFTSQSPKTASDLERYALLLGREQTEAEKAEFVQLKKSLEQAWSVGENDLAREVSEVVASEVKKRFRAAKKEVDPSLIDLEVQRQVHDIFSDEPEDLE